MRSYHLRTPLQWRALDGQWVVMAEDSGSLHQLGALDAALLGLLELGPQTLAQLQDAVADAQGLPLDRGGQAQLAQAVGQLLALDLVAQGLLAVEPIGLQPTGDVATQGVRS